VKGVRGEQAEVRLLKLDARADALATEAGDRLR
jgi:hypothetical protein